MSIANIIILKMKNSRHVFSTFNFCLIATQSAEQQSSGSVGLSQHDSSLNSTNRISHALLVKTSEVFHDEGKRLARYLDGT